MGKPKQVAKAPQNLQPYFEPCEASDKISYKRKLGEWEKMGSDNNQL
jgi:hypothetical protein